jgi:hypothetical protein
VPSCEPMTQKKDERLRKLRDKQSLDRLEEVERSWAILDDDDPLKLRN